MNSELAARGLRVLALAMKEDGATEDADLQGLAWVAFVGLSDRRPGVQETIEVVLARRDGQLMMPWVTSGSTRRGVVESWG